MRRPLLKGCLSFLVLLALLVGWIAGARSFALVFDRMHTVSIDSIPVRELGLEEIESGRLRINRFWMDLADPADRPFPVTFRVDRQHQVKVQSASRSIVLGRINDRSNEIIPAAGEDRVRFETEHGLSWPTPFEINFMTGHSPSWKRHLYYHLSWEKPDRSRLEMVWRYEQYYYDNDKWTNGFMTRAGTTGLIRVDIRP